MRRTARASLAAMTLAFLTVGALTSCASRDDGGAPADVSEKTRFMMGTYVTIHARGPEESAVAAIDAALDRMEEVDDKFNILNPESPLHAFNHDGVPVTDTEILGIIEAALEIARATDGAFDVSNWLAKPAGFFHQRRTGDDGER